MADKFQSKLDDFYYDGSDTRYFSDGGGEDPQPSLEDNDEDERVNSCSCGLPATKDMIGCDSGDCEIEWYHYGCVGFTAETLPDGPWMCVRCHRASKSICVETNEETTQEGEQPVSQGPSKQTKQTEKETKPPRKVTVRGKKVCKYCGRYFASLETLHRHRLLKHQKEKLHTCKVCGRAFIKKQQLRVHHRKLHTKEGLLDCIICGEEFPRARQLRKHHLSHTGEKPLRCDICGKGFIIDYHREVHKELEHQNSARPREVDMVIVSINGQATESHSYAQKDGKVFKCGSCGLLFDKEMDVVIHQVDHQIASLNDLGDLN